MINLNINEQLFEAMRTRQPVMHKGIQYEQILDYIFWYDSNGALRQSVVLLDKRSSVQVLVDEVSLPEEASLAN